MKPRWIGQAEIPGVGYVLAHTTRDCAVELIANADGCWNSDGPLDTWPLMRLDRAGVEGLMELLRDTLAVGVEGLMEMLRDALAAMDGKEPPLAHAYEFWNQFL
jgi:hypothetical protein